jgi:hypothetical protein
MTQLEQYKRFYQLFREVSLVVHSKGELDDVLEMVVSRMVQGVDALGGAVCGGQGFNPLQDAGVLQSPRILIVNWMKLAFSPGNGFSCP